uniref:Uncharacterized protein n=1 Tax=Anguilla anguilla TaxID=7936 RepID=A0A0E9T4P5_ANGAN
MVSYDHFVPVVDDALCVVLHQILRPMARFLTPEHASCWICPWRPS